MTVDAIASEFAHFVTESPTAFHAASVARDRLVAAGFTDLAETDAWPTEPGAYVVVRDGAVIAWRLPGGATATTPFRILGAHTDSPRVPDQAEPVRPCRRLGTAQRRGLRRPGPVDVVRP
ncbi:hypothetical protein [Curtobacterium sp. MCJR17_043]|uniref:hypothetical protein n=1 Tax=Curtobacterium sp. MCJR17_043 TaxID=2175660 RepID=UPI0024DF31B2|nr:hypothetical protein [Curtobacterium sp. MCJR17_043]WIB36677.1 hypothetical protein DEJ15_06295 [Curtobacterium sp. MCJR17_043]